VTTSDGNIRSALAAIVDAIRSGYGAQAERAQDRPDWGFDPAFVERTAPLLEFLWSRYFRVRLLGIDTPETVKPNTPVECFGVEATKHLNALTPKGTTVELVRDVEPRDRYGRLLAYLYRARDHLFVNVAMARDGYAAAYTYPPNVAHASEIVAAASEARDQNRGLWSACGGGHVPA